MRILVLNHEYPPIGGGGGQACRDVAVELVRRGHAVTVLTSMGRGLAREEEDQGVRVVRLPVLRRHFHKASFLSMGLYVLQALVQGRRILRGWRPQVIHVHFAVPAGAAAYRLWRSSATPYVLTAHLGDVPGGSPQKTAGWFRLVFPFTKPIWKHAARVTAVSAFTAQLAKQHYHLEASIIPNGVGYELFAEVIAHPTPAIFFAGRFEAQKNLPVFVDVLNTLRDLDWKCVLLGDGPQKALIEERIRALGLEQRFSLPGWVAPQEVQRTLHHSDILFMPSLTEGFSVVAVQALAAGLAIVANNVGGFSELVEPGKNGVLAAPGDTAVLQQALRAYLQNPAALHQARLYSQRKARAFDILRITDQYEEVLKSAALREA